MENKDFDWNDLKFFLAVARHGGLSAAAASLGTSASTVSRHIATLEARLGATLFLRQQTGYLLTDDGASMHEHIMAVESAMLAMERGGQLVVEQEIAGQVRLATTEMLASYLIAPRLPEFRARYPKLSLEMIISLTRVNLSRREADLALRMIDPTTDENASDYIAHAVGRMDFGAYCAPRLLTGQSSDTEAWRSFDYISWHESWADLPMAKLLSTAFPGRKPALTSNSLHTQYAAARSGVGVAMLPCFIGDHDVALQRLSPSLPVLSRELWLVYHRDLKASQRVIAVRDFVIDLVRTHLISVGDLKNSPP
ncbi:MAG TPA: LysR family transcriptional regulator [Burkholderiales bacterium]|nr:LysR family transcriptional regulator [Burkholderiales bacterium]